MLKKFALPFLLTIFLSVASIQPVQAAHSDSVIVQGDQYEAVGNWTPSTEVNYVEESELARKMAQAQKAEDAKTYDSFGGGITIISMCIVIGALLVLSILFYFFGSISSWFLSHKKKQTNLSTNLNKGESDHDHSPDSGETIAAIAAALAQHFSADHDMEDTILTIRRMRKAYSPWNSKIYNMRTSPEFTKHSVKIGK